MPYAPTIKAMWTNNFDVLSLCYVPWYIRSVGDKFVLISTSIEYE